MKEKGRRDRRGGGGLMGTNRFGGSERGVREKSRENVITANCIQV